MGIAGRKRADLKFSRLLSCLLGPWSTDLIMLAGKYRYAPKIPFVPGFEVAAQSKPLALVLNRFRTGPACGGAYRVRWFAELLVRNAEHFLPAPDGVSDRDAAAVILNYVTAWQMIHRVAKLRPGQTAVVTGAAGGVGTAACSY